MLKSYLSDKQNMHVHYKCYVGGIMRKGPQSPESSYQKKDGLVKSRKKFKKKKRKGNQIVGVIPKEGWTGYLSILLLVYDNDSGH